MAADRSEDQRGWQAQAEDLSRRGRRQLLDLAKFVAGLQDAPADVVRKSREKFYPGVPAADWEAAERYVREHAGDFDGPHAAVSEAPFNPSAGRP